MQRPDVTFAVLAVLVCFCGNTSPPQPPQPTAAVSVRSWGELRQVIHAGDRSAQVTLQDVLRLPHCYAVGALDGLRGEVTIVDGEVWLSYPSAQDSYRVLRTKETLEKATLLVAAHVSTWQERALTDELDADHLDETLAKLARNSGIDTSKPFPFIVQGRFPQVSFHVIDGRRVGGTGDHAAHAAAGVLRTERDRQGILVGFYSEHHQGVFTHLGQRTHLHLVADSPAASGHVDTVVIRAGSVLKLPPPRRPAAGPGW